MADDSQQKDYHHDNQPTRQNRLPMCFDVLYAIPKKMFYPKLPLPLDPCMRLAAAIAVHVCTS